MGGTTIVFPLTNQTRKNPFLNAVHAFQNKLNNKLHKDIARPIKSGIYLLLISQNKGFKNISNAMYVPS